MDVPVVREGWPLTAAGSDEGADDVARLVARARIGEHAAFGRLYRRFSPMVHGVLLASVPALEVADLQQDVFARAWASLSELRRAGSFGPWLAAIARRRAADWHREPRPTGGTPERLATVPQLAERLALLQAIRALPPAYAETLILRLVEGLTGPEIAAHTGKTHRSVRVNLHRGMKMLREQLGGERRAR